MIPKPAVDYCRFRLRRWKDPEFSHVRLLLFWPVFGLLFFLAERNVLSVTYQPVFCPLDDLIPFCEWFLIPYLYWFLFLAGGLLYGFLYDPQSFRRTMWFIIVTYSLTLLVYLLWPTCQNLRPAVFPRDNLLTRFVAAFYNFDTNTNVCPSIHVLGSVAIPAGLWHSPAFRGRTRRTALCVQAALISVSTVFMKQHSILDVLAAIPLCILGYMLIHSRFFENFCKTH